MNTRKQTFGMLKKSGAADLTVHVNMAPMIDFLVITIAFLLMSASYFSIGMIDSWVATDPVQAPNSSSSQAGSVDNRVLEILIRSTNELSATIVSSEERTELSFGSDKEALKTRLAGQQFSSITLNAESGIKYGEVVQLLSELRSLAPHVSLNVESH